MGDLFRKHSEKQPGLKPLVSEIAKTENEDTFSLAVVRAMHDGAAHRFAKHHFLTIDEAKRAEEQLMAGVGHVCDSGCGPWRWDRPEV